MYERIVVFDEIYVMYAIGNDQIQGKSYHSKWQQFRNAPRMPW